MPPCQRRFHSRSCPFETAIWLGCRNSGISFALLQRRYPSLALPLRPASVSTGFRMTRTFERPPTSFGQIDAPANARPVEQQRRTCRSQLRKIRRNGLRNVSFSSYNEGITYLSAGFSPDTNFFSPVATTTLSLEHFFSPPPATSCIS